MTEVTAAVVKFCQDGFITLLPITEILQFSKKLPINKEDFNKNALYRAWWKDDRNPQKMAITVQIGALACGKDEEKILEKKRISFPPINKSDLDLISENTDNESNIEEAVKVIKVQRLKNIKSAKHTANMKHIRSFHTNSPYFGLRKPITDEIISSDSSDNDVIQPPKKKASSKLQLHQQHMNCMDLDVDHIKNISNTDNIDRPLNLTLPLEKDEYINEQLKKKNTSRKDNQEPHNPVHIDESAVGLDNVSVEYNNRKPDHWNDEPLNIVEDIVNDDAEQIVQENDAQQRHNNEIVGQQSKRNLIVYKLKQARVEFEGELNLSNAIETPDGGEDINPEGKNKYDKIGDKIYLGEGKCIDQEFWNILNKQNKWVFVRELCVILWSRRVLVNRCIKPSRISICLKNRSPRKQLTPKKYRLLKELFNDYLEGNEVLRAKKKLCFQRLNTHIGYKIKDLRNSMYEICQ